MYGANCVLDFYIIGYTNRTCLQNDFWGPPDVLDCRRVEHIQLEMKAQTLSGLIDGLTVDNQRDLRDIVMDLANITDSNQPIFPNDLCSTALTLDIMMAYVTNFY